MLEIARVLPGSAAARLGLASGDALISVNGEEINDCIDYAFTIADEHPSLVVKKKGGSLVETAVPKEPDDDLGLEFAPLRVRRCRNRCVFCFVDQMPKGCRRSLYVKDDDFRASFLFGNYITPGGPYGGRLGPDLQPAAEPAVRLRPCHRPLSPLVHSGQ